MTGHSFGIYSYTHGMACASVAAAVVAPPSVLLALPRIGPWTSHEGKDKYPVFIWRLPRGQTTTYCVCELEPNFISVT